VDFKTSLPFYEDLSAGLMADLSAVLLADWRTEPKFLVDRKGLILYSDLFESDFVPSNKKHPRQAEERHE